MAKEAKSNNNKDVKNKKHFWKEFKAELKKVIWPSPKQLANKTFAVIVIVLITAAIVFVLDLGFDYMNKGINSFKKTLKNEESAGSVLDYVVEEHDHEHAETENVVEENTVENAE